MNFAHSKEFRALSLLLGLVFAISVFISVAFVLAEAHHHCTEEHCVICAAIAHNVSNLKAETSVLTPPVDFMLWSFAAMIIIANGAQACVVKPSLVSLKVKLSD